MKATDFEYDNRKLSSFGMILCSFDDKGLNTISNGSEITFNTISTLNGNLHRLTSSSYEDCLTATFQICKNLCGGGTMEIDSITFRELTRWLNRKKFLKLKILDEDYVDIYYEASFNISRIEIDGKLVGLELEVITNRPFALKEPKIINVKLDKVYGWEEYKDAVWQGYVTSTNENAYSHNGIPTEDGYQRIYLGEVYKGSINDDSYEEGYIYPHTEVTINQNGNLKIYNAIEDRDTYIANCVTGEVITLDYPIIQSSISSHKIENDFNWQFFRVANTFENSRNDLIVTLPCSIKIEYSPIVKVGL